MLRLKTGLKIVTLASFLVSGSLALATVKPSTNQFDPQGMRPPYPPPVKGVSVAEGEYEYPSEPLLPRIKSAQTRPVTPDMEDDRLLPRLSWLLPKPGAEAAEADVVPPSKGKMRVQVVLTY